MVQRSSFWPRRALTAVVAPALLYVACAAAGCRFDRSDRWLTITSDASCTEGEVRCQANLQRCTSTADGLRWVQAEDCVSQGRACNVALKACTACEPGSATCKDGDVYQCGADGQAAVRQTSCDRSQGLACRGGACQNLCLLAQKTRSNVGCEYWGVDLDNASLGASNNAAAQQFAVVVSNPETDLTATVTVTQDNSLPGASSEPVVVATATVAPRSLRVFKLGPREVDGSPDGEFNTGTGTALTRHAYQIKSDTPVVAYQFNPLENVNVFSNDASLLKPVEALGAQAAAGEPSLAYVAVGWGQTIARTDDPNTNFDPSGGTQLRVFLTLVGTRPGTRVRVHPTTRVIPGGPIAETQAGGLIEAQLEPYDVLNLETGGFNADFTGTLIEANGPLVVFSGSEASDAPMFTTLANRYCCADHLEDQLDPIRTAGTRFIGAHGPSRTTAVALAGGPVTTVPEPDFFRPVTTVEGDTTITTTLPPPDDHFVLSGRGQSRILTVYRDFALQADHPIHLGNISPSQEAAGIKRGLPGGDPSLLIVPPIEQWRPTYVFLTPDKYSFDFVTVIAEPGVPVTLDGDALDDKLCTITPADGLTAVQRGADAPPYLVYTCQLSFPLIDPDPAKKAPDNVSPGTQNDGVHQISAPSPVGVLISGFDSFVSYGYAAGTQLQELSIE
jgi:hypothetical protein